MRILICEDSVLLREGLVRLLEDAGHEVVAALPDATGLDEAVDETNPELCILDVRLPPTFVDEPSGNGALNGIPVTVTPVRT